MKREEYEHQNMQQTVAVTDTFSTRRYIQFAKHLPPEVVNVLDVGCAEGVGGTQLKSLRPSIQLAGLDCVEERLSLLPDCYDRGILGLSNAIPLADQSMDAIVAGEFLEHLYPADVDKTLCEFQRVLKIGGVLLMTTPNPYSIKMRLRRGSVYGTAHLTQHFPKVLGWRLKLHGFSRVRIRGSGKAMALIGEHFPLLSVYGSYLISGTKR